jgi:hypothetical protein
MARRASPTERSSALQAMPTPSSTVLGSVMHKKRCANSSTRPSAPSNCSKGDSQNKVAAVRATASKAQMTRLDVPSARASAMRWAPI